MPAHSHAIQACGFSGGGDVLDLKSCWLLIAIPCGKVQAFLGIVHLVRKISQFGLICVQAVCWCFAQTQHKEPWVPSPLRNQPPQGAGKIIGSRELRGQVCLMLLCNGPSNFALGRVWTPCLPPRCVLWTSLRCTLRWQCSPAGIIQRIALVQHTTRQPWGAGLAGQWLRKHTESSFRARVFLHCSWYPSQSCETLLAHRVLNSQRRWGHQRETETQSRDQGQRRASQGKPGEPQQWNATGQGERRAAEGEQTSIPPE